MAFATGIYDIVGGSWEDNASKMMHKWLRVDIRKKNSGDTTRNYKVWNGKWFEAGI